MFLGNDGPHIASLAIIPLALWGMIVFLRKGEVKNFILAAVSSSLVMLISPFGFSIFIGLTFITTFSEMLLGRVRLKLSRLFFVLIATFGIVSFWYNPQFSFSLVFGPLGKELRTTIGQLIPISLFAIPVLASFGYLLFDRKPQLQPLFLATFFTIAFTLITMIGGGLFPSHPSRYAPELGMSLSFLIGTGVIGVIDYLKFHKIKKFKFLNTKIFTNSILAGVIVISVLTILIKGGPSAFSSNVLGLWTGVERGTIWRAREEVGKTSSVSGYLITGITTLSLVATGIKYKKGI